MADITVDSDQFAAALTKLLTDINGEVRKGATKAVRKGLEEGEERWKENARSSLSKRYFKTGRWYTTGEYADSISHRMTRTGETPSGSVGSKDFPGLPHLLEKGHARVGGGRVAGIPHIAPAAAEAFKTTIEVMEEQITEALR